jgi:hypothetical protein
MIRLNSGEIAPKTGTYNVVNSKGKVCGKVNVRKGDRIPPSHDASHRFEIE